MDRSADIGDIIFEQQGLRDRQSVVICLTVFLVVIPLSPGGFVLIHHDIVTLSHPAVEGLHEVAFFAVEKILQFMSFGQKMFRVDRLGRHR